MLLRKPFFKIPIDKLVTKIKDPTHPDRIIKFNRSQQAMLQGLEDHRFHVHIAARRTGKSFSAAILALAKLLEPHQNVTVVAPDYSLSSILWDYVTGFIGQLGLETDKFNAKDRVVILCNGSTFRLLSANHEQSLIGRGAHLIIVDEAAVIPTDNYFQQGLRPSLTTFEGSRALFISTPRGKANYLYSYFLRGSDPDYEEWGSALFDWTANPFLNKDDIEEARKSLTHQKFRQEYYCEWSTFENQIYALDEEKHLINVGIEPGDTRYDFIGGLDMGYRDPSAFVVVATNGENYYTVDSWSDSKATTDVVADEIRQRMDKWNIDNIYIDSAAAQAKADLAYNYDIYCDNANKKSVNDGISYLQVLVENDNLFFDEEGAGGVFRMLAGYRWNPKTETQKPLHDDCSHYADALRYAIYSHYQASGEVFFEA